MPVVLDCAWYGTCYDLDFDVNHPAITEVSFSLSKGIGLGNMRTGVRFSNYAKNDTMSLAQQNSYGLFSVKQLSTSDNDGRIWVPTGKQISIWTGTNPCKYSMLESNWSHVAMLSISLTISNTFFNRRIYGPKVGVREALKAIRRGELKV